MSQDVCPDCNKNHDSEFKKRLKNIILTCFREFGEYVINNPAKDDEDHAQGVVSFVDKFVDKNF